MRTEQVRRIAGCATLAIAAGCLALGITRGEVVLVLAKAVRVCMECIGLG